MTVKRESMAAPIMPAKCGSFEPGKSAFEKAARMSAVL